MYYFDANSHHFEHFHDFQNIQSESKGWVPISTHQKELSDTARRLEAPFYILMFLIVHWHFHLNNFNNSEHHLTVVLG
jgi:hypothetical protein